MWFVKTKNEINGVAHSKILTAWLLILPIVSIRWEWKFAVGVEEATNGGLGRHAAFWILWLLGPLGALLVQMSLNTAIDSSVSRRTALREPLPA